jgi:hypothetical protein
VEAKPSGGRDFRFDRRLERGITPPFFPRTAQLELLAGSNPLAGVRPVWREVGFGP